MSNKPTEGKPAYDAGDRAVVKKRKTRAQLEEERANEEFGKVLSTWEGRRFIWWLLEQSGMYKTTFRPSPYTTAFLEGQRQLGIKTIERIFKSDAKAYGLMRAEAQRIEEENDR